MADSSDLLLAIESSCDETAAAVVTRDRRVLANVVASQTGLHERFGGVVPEIASRAHLQRILPVIDEALRKAGARLDRRLRRLPSSPNRDWSARCWSD